MARFCTNCGNPLEDAAKFCASCGEQTVSAPPVNQVQPTWQPQPQAQQPYMQPQQQPFNQQQYAFAPAGPSKKKKSKLLLIVLSIIGVFIIAVALGVILLINGISSSLNNTAKADYYELGRDKIPSVKLALGEERKVTGVRSSISNNETTKEIKYEVSGTDQKSDMWDYYSYLRDNDSFLSLTDIEFSGSRGTGVVGRNSLDDGYIVQLQIEYDQNGYTITISKQPGEITPNPTENNGSNGDPAYTISPEALIDDNDTQISGNTGALTKSIFSTLMGGGTYHMKMKVKTGESAEEEAEIFFKNGKTAMPMKAEGEDTRVVYKDGKVYVVMDAYKMVIVSDITAGNEAPDMGDTSNLTYIGEGSGEFDGGNYRYDEYTDNDGGRHFYYVDGAAWKGVRTIAYGETSDVVMLEFDNNVPDSVFDIPADYEVVNG